MKLPYKVHVLPGMCLSVLIKAEAKLRKYLLKCGVIPLADSFGRFFLLFRPNCNRRTVTIAAGHIENPVSDCPVIPGNRIARQKRGDASDMQRSVCIGPRAPDEYVFHVHPPRNRKAAKFYNHH